MSELYDYFVKYRRNNAVILILILLSSVSGLVFPFGVKFLFDHIVPYKRSELIPLFVLAMFSLLALKAIFSIYQEKLSAQSANLFITDLREKLFRETISAGPERVHQMGAGHAASILLGDVQSLENLIQNGIIAAISSSVMAIAFFAALLYVHFILAILSFVTLPFFLYFFVRLNRTIRLKTQENRKATGKLYAFFTEALEALSTIRLNGLEEIFILRQKRLNHALCWTGLQQKVKQEVFSSLAYLCFMLSFVVVLSLSAFFAISGRMTTGSLLAFYIILQGLFQPLMGLLVSFRIVQKDSAVLERIESFLGIKEEKKENIIVNGLQQGRAVPERRAAVEVRNVSFSRNGNRILSDINIRINKGGKVLIVGLNGTGKTTLIKLIMGFIHPEKGDICICGNELRNNREKQDIFSFFSAVEQDRHVLSGSLRLNLDSGKTHSPQALRQKLHLFHLEGVCPSQRIEAKGKNLSQGERQRIAVLRAFIRNAPIYVFDEAFSSQDAVSSSILQDFLKELPSDRTFIGVTHQLSIAPFIDKIYLMDGGRIAEEGSHRELLSRKGLYFNLYSIYSYGSTQQPVFESIAGGLS